MMLSVYRAAQVIMIWGASSFAIVSAQSDCETRINHHRVKYGIDLITEREDLHSCVNRQSEFDDAVRAHASYGRCGAIGSQGSGSGASCSAVIDLFFNERWHCSRSAVFGTPIKETTLPNIRNCRQACLDDAFCLSYDYDDGADSCRFFGDASITRVRNVDNDLWLGYPEGTKLEPSIVDFWTSFSMIEVDGSNKVPMVGQITAFKWYGSNASPVRFFVYRPLVDSSATTTFEVIGQARAAATVVGEENTIVVSPAIQVQKGDVIGWTWEGSPAFGFDASGAGQVLFKNQQDSGGPTSVGDQWTFDGGPEGRAYHVAASFVPEGSYPTSGEARNYCAAALCQGHCGPVMHGGTTKFAWGEFNNHYTLNWRPSARLPFGGNECPSGIQAVKCWTDPVTGVLWAYGVGGEDCHSTCSLAGANPSDLMCDVSSPITGGFDQVSQIMANFENPYSNTDPGEFSCTTGRCWQGETWRQISIYEYNSNCYVPTNQEQYTCDAKFGNANCLGQRFNQVCPCVPGCSWAAGPSCAPSEDTSASPTLSLSSSSLPSLLPSVTPSAKQTEPTTTSDAPSSTPSELCKDTKNTFIFANGAGREVEKGCGWARYKPERCGHDPGIPAACPVVCGTCDICEDSSLKFLVRLANGTTATSNCAWVAADAAARCNLPGVPELCRPTCGLCLTSAPTTSSPSVSSSPSLPPSIKSSDAPTAGCIDTTNAFLFLNGAGREVEKDCGWARSKPERCGNDPGIPAACPVVCGTCDICEDSSVKFIVRLANGTKVIEDCDWVAADAGRCELSGVPQICRTTCQNC